MLHCRVDLESFLISSITVPADIASEVGFLHYTIIGVVVLLTLFPLSIFWRFVGTALCTFLIRTSSIELKSALLDTGAQCVLEPRSRFIVEMEIPHVPIYRPTNPIQHRLCFPHSDQ